MYAKSGSKGLNFGWDGNDDRPLWKGGFLDTGSSGTPIIGGVVYRGKKMPGFCGRYIYGFHGGGIKSLKVVNGEAMDVQSHNLETADIGGWGIDGEGEIYYANYGDGTVYKVEAQ